MSSVRERLVAGGFRRRVEADVVRARFEKHAVAHRLGLDYLVRRVEGVWHVYQRARGCS